MAACRALAGVARAFPFMRAEAELAAGDLALVSEKTARARTAFAAALESAEACKLTAVAKRARERLKRVAS